jgi:hypothetical protein
MQGVFVGESPDAAYRHCVELNPDWIKAQKWELSPYGYRSIWGNRSPSLGVYVHKGTVVAVNGHQLNAGTKVVATELDDAHHFDSLGPPDDGSPNGRFMAWRIGPSRLLVVELKDYNHVVDTMYLGDMTLYGSGEFHNWSIPEFLVHPTRSQ